MVPISTKPLVPTLPPTQSFNRPVPSVNPPEFNCVTTVNDAIIANDSTEFTITSAVDDSACEVEGAYSTGQENGQENVDINCVLKEPLSMEEDKILTNSTSEHSDMEHCESITAKKTCDVEMQDDVKHEEEYMQTEQVTGCTSKTSIRPNQSHPNLVRII